MSNFRRIVNWVKFHIRRRTKRSTLPAYLDSLGTGDVVIDCGANVGKIATEFAKSGATVYAFEPDEVAFPELQKNVAHMDNVICMKSAVSAEDGQTKLFHRPDRGSDELLSTQGSSLESKKANVNESDFQLVETIDLARFITDLDTRVACIKMDIEGHEATVLEHLLEAGALSKVDSILVETHERKVPGLGERLDALKPRMAELEHLRRDWNWI